MAVVGRVLLIPRGSWTSTDTYNRLDWVRYNGVAWVCKQDNTTGVIPSTSASEWQILAQDGTVGGWSSIMNKPFDSVGSGLMVNSSKELMVAKNLVTDKTTVQALNELLTGTGTAGYDAGAGASPRYFPAKYIYNTMLTVVDGDMVTIKLPVAGSEYGVYVSLDNGSTYHPVALQETTKFSTEYGVGAYITLIYDALGSVSDIYPEAGGDTPGTVTGGAFKVLNYALSSPSYNVDDPAGTTIDDEDYFPFYDTSATAKKKSLWSNIKAKLKAYFDGLYTLLTIVGTVESSATASKAYAIGNHFIKDGYFCTATAAIAQGATLTLNTNYTRGDIAGATYADQSYGSTSVKAQSGKAVAGAINGLKPLIKLVIGYCSYTAPANGNFQLNPTQHVTIPTGYVGMGIIGYLTNNQNVYIVNIKYEDSDVGIFGRNISSSAVSATFNFYVLCVKSGFYS